jgi:hypothetical protein
MKMILKSALALAAIATATVTISPMANAGVDVSVGIGTPAVVYAPGPGYSPYEGRTYYDPVYFGGAWYHGPYRWRMEHGERVFWVNGGWHRNEWSGGAIPGSISFHNGGYYRGGRYDGFDGADRINARFPAPDRAMHANRPDIKPAAVDARPDAAKDSGAQPRN